MSAQLQLSVPEPCSMRWSGMSHVDEGKRHCGSCDKVITDFTRMSDEQLLSYFRNNGKTCGMFAPHQLNRVIAGPKKKQNPWAAAFLLPALLALTEARAQETKPAPAIEQTADTTKPDIPLSDASSPTKDTLIVSGSVVGAEHWDSLQKYPLSSAVVVFHLPDSTRTGCVSDLDGKFRMKLPDMVAGDTVVVEVRYTGYFPYRTTFTLQERETVLTLEPQPNIESYTMGVIIETTPRSRVRGFFWRLFHPRYWFRK